MVALAVFALAALALLRLEGATLRGTGAVERSLLAGLVARNVAVEAVTDARAPALGLADGAAVNGGRTWRWRRTVAPLGDAGVLRVDVTVSDATGQTLGRATLIRPPDATPSAVPS